MTQTRLKLFLLVLTDFITIFVAQLIAKILLDLDHENSYILVISILSFIFASSLNGFYKTSISHLGISAVKQAIISILVYGLILYIYGETIIFILFSSLLASLGIIGYRVFTREFLFQHRHSNASKTIVYGAGSAGIQFTSASMQGDTYNVVGFIDDDDKLCNTSIHGRIVYPSNDIETLVSKHNVKIVVLALPSISKIDRKRIIESLISLPIRVVTIPTFEDLIEGKQITQTENISVEDLLGREPVPPLENHMRARTSNKICLVSGAGGSIGSELCRQIVRCEPKHLILIDFSEPSLFKIQQDLLQHGFNNITCYLGSVTDTKFIDRIFNNNHIDSVFHAAAYKHVPMVEANPIAGLVNNVEGTKNILRASQEFNCGSFTLISTDKAVRPTNIMGASKRLAEMICQAASEASTNDTVISIVRFGNVLGSSGSVIPTFQKQIYSGGPVTLTHPNITRYFMTIPEAAELVIQASGMAKNGDLFLLDMGTPVKILDLATRLIRLSGKKIKQNPNNNENGAIEIKITGLRPGEKLYEELLIDAATSSTDHPKIMKAREKHINLKELEEGYKELLNALIESNYAKSTQLLSQLVEGYNTVG